MALNYLAVNSLFPFDRHHFKSDYLFEELSPEIFDILIKDQDVVLYGKGQIIFHEGTRPMGVYYVRSGKIKKFTKGYEGKEHIFYICKERELLGYHSLLSEETNPDSAAAIEDSEVVFIPKKNFIEALNDSPELMQKVIKSLSHEFGVFVNSSKILAQFSVRERTALALLVLHEKYKSQEKGDSVIDLSREELASVVGTAKETLVRVLHDFKEDGFIKIQGRGIVVQDLDGLARISNYYN